MGYTARDRGRPGTASQAEKSMETESNLTNARRAPHGTSTLRALVGAIAGISVMGLATGVTLPLVSLRLVEAGASATAIAVMAALPALGTIGMSFCLAPLTRRLGAKTLMVAAIVLSGVCVLILATPYAPLPWLLSRLGTGVSASILFGLGEARILEISSDAARGRWTGLYATTLTTCQFAGPAMLAALGTASGLPLYVAAGLHVLSGAFVVGSRWRDTAPAVPQAALTLRAFLHSSLPLASAVLFFAMFDSAVLALLPVYGLRLGLATRLAILLATVVFLGDACLQIPIGWAADRFGRPRTHLVCALVTGLIAFALYAGAAATPALWLGLFLMGGTAGALYTLAIVRLGDRLRGTRLISANAFVGMLWGLGALCGPVAGSLAMAAAQPQGLMLFVAAGAFGCLILMLRGRRADPGPRRAP
jgi:MFS family permease